MTANIVRGKNVRKPSERISATKNFVLEFCPEKNLGEVEVTKNCAKFLPTRKSSKKNVKSLSELQKSQIEKSSMNRNSTIVNHNLSKTLYPKVGKNKWKLLEEKEKSFAKGELTTNLRVKNSKEKNSNDFYECETNDELKNLSNLHLRTAGMKEKACTKSRAINGTLEELQRRLRMKKCIGESFDSRMLDLVKKSWAADSNENLKNLGFCEDRSKQHDTKEIEFKNSTNNKEQITELDESRMKMDIENYLDNYDAMDKIEREEKNYSKALEVREPTTEEVENILAKLNIRNGDFCEFVDEDNSTSRNDDSENISTVVKNVDNSRDTWTEIEDDDSIKIPKITGSKSWENEKCFLTIGLNESRDRIPDYFVSPILKSVYLRTEPDLNLI